MPATTTPVAHDQFAGRPRIELEAMCRMRGLRVNDTDNAQALRRRLRTYQAARQQENVERFVTPPSRVDSDTAARMALIDREVRGHFADHPDPITSRAIAGALRRNQQEVLLSMQRLGCPRLTGGLYGPPPTPTQEATR